MLSDGRLLAGFQQRSGIYDPATDQWEEIATPMSGDCYETTWTLLPDGSVLQPYMLSHPAAQRFVPSLGRWIDAPPVPADLVPADFEEVGPALLLYDGRVLEIGATGHTDFFHTPAEPDQPGSWEVGPDLPPDDRGAPMTARDAPAVLLPNGRPLVVVGPSSNDWSGPPSRFYELAADQWVPAGDLPPAASLVTYVGVLLLLPSTPLGQVLYSYTGTDLWVYTANAEDGGPDDAWRPRITACDRQLHRGDSYTLFGRTLNGLSQACSYGDDATNATNYPLIRLTDASGQVFYCRTHDHSSMGVAATEGWTNFDVPGSVPLGTYQLEVVANGIASQPIEVTVLPFRSHLQHYGLWQRLIGSLADGPLWELRGNKPVPVDPLPFGVATKIVEMLLEDYGSKRKAPTEGKRLTADVASVRAPKSHPTKSAAAK